ncbi:MAG: M48 family metalloprotease [Gammaproteobacteria bacterium]
MKHLLLLIVASFSLSVFANKNSDLPDLGLSASARISSTQEYQLGRAIVRDLQLRGAILQDPELTAYIQALGNRIAVHAHDGEQRFTFFVVNDPDINAFALPGGFIGIHTGLLAATRNENELAGVISHEIAHVSQKHIARMIESQSQTSVLTTAATLAALLVGALTGADGQAIGAAVQVAQGAAIQQRINFTRDNEYEADRVGINFLYEAGFDPQGMPDFFNTLSRRSGVAGQQVPEFLRTHPVTSNRIAETRNRAALLPSRQVPSSMSYSLAKARLNVLSESNSVKALNKLEARIEGHPSEERDDVQYAYGLALIKAGKTSRAVELIEPLFERNQNTVAHHILYGEALFADGQTEAAVTRLKRSQILFPRNVPLTMSHSSILIEADEPDEARELMLDLVNNVEYTTEQLRILANAANAAGYNGDSHYYMSEFHVLNGQLTLAADQLKMALKSPDIRDYQYARIETRLEDIEDVIVKSRRSGRRRPKSQSPRQIAR